MLISFCVGLYLRFSILVVMGLFPVYLQAGVSDVFTKAKYRFALDYYQFNSDAIYGLGSSTIGYGGLIGLQYGTGRFRGALDLTGIYVSGVEQFQDGSVQRKLDVNGLLLGIAPGFYLDLLGSTNSKATLTFSANGVAEYTYLKLPVDATLTNIAQTDNGVFVGYSVGLGLQWKIFSKPTVIEARYRSLTGKIFERSDYSTSGLGVRFGVQY
ncbi:MAG: hypothetical protein BroJett040_21180 [Oligoflexia bacterium]|nr:MAG: hypothetical protein BroJett040_21180 [Oligoflexia bacterium]